MTIDKHIYFSNDEYHKVKEYAKENKLTFSKATCKLCLIALENIKVLEMLETMNKELKYLNNKIRINHALTEQLYSNFDFENIINVKDSIPLKNFNSKYRGNNIND